MIRDDKDQLAAVEEPEHVLEHARRYEHHNERGHDFVERRSRGKSRGEKHHVEQEGALADGDVPPLFHGHADNVNAAARSEGAQHDAAARTEHDAAEHGRVYLILQGNGKVHEQENLAGGRGHHCAVGRVEQEAPAHEEPAPDENGGRKQDVPGRGVKERSPVVGEQGHAHDAAGKESVRGRDALQADGVQDAAHSEPEQIPPHRFGAASVEGAFQQRRNSVR